MAIFTYDQFTNITKSKLGTKSFKGIVQEARNYSKASNDISIFLSHSHKDKELVEQAITFLKSMRISVYIDWMDETMSDKPNGITASRIKSKIITNDKFILLATNAAVVSKWCNWEVGIGDAYKLHNDKICLLPLADNKGNWEGNEYLQIYPRVESVKKDNYSIHENIFYLIYPDSKQIWFDDWLKK
jgi:hypothetical protein